MQKILDIALNIITAAMMLAVIYFCMTHGVP